MVYRLQPQLSRDLAFEFALYTLDRDAVDYFFEEALDNHAFSI
jgi:hypothetical protein